MSVCLALESICTHLKLLGTCAINGFLWLLKLLKIEIEIMYIWQSFVCCERRCNTSLLYIGTLQVKRDFSLSPNNSLEELRYSRYSL